MGVHVSSCFIKVLLLLLLLLWSHRPTAAWFSERISKIDGWWI